MKLQGRHNFPVNWLNLEYQTNKGKYVAGLQRNCRNRGNSIFQVTPHPWWTDRAAVFWCHGSNRTLKRLVEKYCQTATQLGLHD